MSKKYYYYRPIPSKHSVNMRRHLAFTELKYHNKSLELRRRGHWKHLSTIPTCMFASVLVFSGMPRTPLPICHWQRRKDCIL